MLTSEQIEQYQTDGVLHLRQVVSNEWIAQLAQGVEQNLREPGPFARFYTPEGNPGKFFGDYCNWQRIDSYRSLFFESTLAQIAGQLMRSRKVNLYHEHVLVKEPGTLEKTPWHHDQPYYPVDGKDIISFWIPLDPVPKASCPEYITGSHRWGKWYAPKRFADAKDHANTSASYEAIPDEAQLRAQHPIVSYDLALGDCIAFHGLTVHGAPANLMSSRRRAFSARFTGDDARFILREGFMSPPPPEQGGPVNGAAMDSEAFPVLRV